MFVDLPLLSLVIWLPIVGGALVLFLGDSRPAITKWLALTLGVLTFILSCGLWAGYELQNTGMQFVERLPWIPAFGADYYLGIDGISMPMIVLTTFMTLFVLVGSWESVSHKLAQYLAAFLIMEGIMIGAFSALDSLLFYVFWEAMLIPMFLIIGIWGGQRRVYATIKFFLFTFFGSVLMLVAFLYMQQQTNSFDVMSFHRLDLSKTEQTWIFLALMAAFAVKVPMWPVHTWLPDAHTEAPTGGSVILAAITLKLGAYGFLRFSMPIAPDASLSLSFLVIALSLIAIVYIGFVALAQEDMKRLIAYSSIAHMGFVTLGFFIPFSIVSATGSHAGAAMAVQGALVQMISHGFISGALFLCVGVLYDRMHTREITAYGGVINVMPSFAAFMVFFFMANSGLPGTSGFVGEFMVIMSSFKANFWYAVLAASTLILGAAYSLWLVKRVVFGEITNPEVKTMQDLSWREFALLAGLAVPVLVVGVWPRPLVDVIAPTVDVLLAHVMQGKL